jgi:hypothetical protein
MVKFKTIDWRNVKEFQHITSQGSNYFYRDCLITWEPQDAYAAQKWISRILGQGKTNQNNKIIKTEGFSIYRSARLAAPPKKPLPLYVTLKNIY